MKHSVKGDLSILLVVVLMIMLVPSCFADDDVGRDKLSISCSSFTPGLNWMTDDIMYYNWKNRLQELTNTELVYVGNRFQCLSTETLLLMIADDSLPDLYWGPDLFASTSTAPSVMIEDGYLLKLNDYMDQLPNFSRYLEENPEYAASIMLEDGTLFGFPVINSQIVTKGLLVRGDWLEELNMDIPKTPEQLKEFLYAARDVLGVEHPLQFQSEFLDYIMPRGWDNSGTQWYVEDGKVKIGITEPGYKEYVEEVHEWYAEGLIDPDMPSASKQSVEAAMSNGTAAAVYNQIYKVENMYDFNKDNPSYTVLGTNLGASDDELPYFGGVEGGVAWADAMYINPKTENLDAALRFCDFMFSKEGIILNNYGTRGFSFDYDEEGNYIEAGVLLDNTIDVTNVNKLYAVAKRGSWPGIVEGQLFGFIKPSVDVGKEWLKTRAMEHSIPYLVFTEEENSRYAPAWNDSLTLVRESVIQFVMGTKPMDEFDAFMEQLYEYGIEECIAIRQAAYDRYLNTLNMLIE